MWFVFRRHDATKEAIICLILKESHCYPTKHLILFRIPLIVKCTLFSYHTVSLCQQALFFQTSHCYQMQFLCTKSKQHTLFLDYAQKILYGKSNKFQMDVFLYLTGGDFNRFFLVTRISNRFNDVNLKITLAQFTGKQHLNSVGGSQCEGHQHMTAIQPTVLKRIL